MNSNANSKSKQAIATVAMLIAAVIWGLAFIPQKTASEHLGALSLSGIRFLLGAFVVYLFRCLWLKKFSFTGKELRSGLLLGVFLLCAVVLQQWGVETTTAGKAGFITGLYLIFVPLLLRIFWKQPATMQVLLGAILALVGLYFLSVSESFSVSGGDLLVLACAITFAFHIVFIGLYAPQIDPVALSIIQAITCGITSLCLALFIEHPSAAAISAAWREILYLGILSVGIAYTIQVIAQRFLSAVLVGFIASLESVFAVLGGALFLNETLSQRQFLGCALMLIGIALSQIKFSKTQTVPLTEHTP